MTREELRNKWIANGMTEERIDWFLDEYAKRLSPTDDIEEEIEYYVMDWGMKDVNNGYSEFTHFHRDYKHGVTYELFMICRLDDMAVFDGDEDACKQAIKDGTKIIPITELPNNLPEDLVQPTWLDDKQTREALNKIANNNK